MYADLTHELVSVWSGRSVDGCSATGLPPFRENESTTVRCIRSYLGVEFPRYLTIVNFWKPTQEELIRMHAPAIVAIVGVIIYAVFRNIKGFNWVAELGKLAFLAGLLAFLLKASE
jgi:hypothetical protein